MTDRDPSRDPRTDPSVAYFCMEYGLDNDLR